MTEEGGYPARLLARSVPMFLVSSAASFSPPGFPYRSGSEEIHGLSTSPKPALAFGISKRLSFLEFGC